MKLHRLAAVIASLYSISHYPVNAEELWAFHEQNVEKQSKQLNVAADKGALFHLKTEVFQDKIKHAANEFEMQIPLPNGKLTNLLFKQNSIFAPELAAKFPNIKSFEVFSLTGERLGRFSYSSNGFHGMFKHEGRYVMLDPKYKGDPNTYLSYYRTDARRIDDSNVIKEDPELFESLKKYQQNEKQKRDIHAEARPTITGDSIRTYRLAVAAAGDYTQFHGGTLESGIAAINVLFNRINEIYLVELAVQFELVANNDKIIFTDPDTDPYSNEDSDLDTNQQTLDELIGSDNYDIGHLVNGAAGGVAIAAVCDSEAKAKGLTGSSEPTGDAFHVDYVAHEIGHQFGANHSYNGQEAGCNTRVADAAVEPGSGSTIMSYANLCGSQDLQSYSDPSFHIRSIEEIRAFIANGSASACGTTTAITNNPPTSNAGADYTIPANTPFKLTGEGSDPDDDAITYIWEQRNPNGKKTNSAEEMIDNGSNPLFRTFTPKTDGTRYFPRMSDLLDNNSVKGQTFATTTRTMNFYLTVKDSKGGVASDSMALSTFASNGFRIMHPSANKGWNSGVANLLRWDTANTEQAPVSCDKVNVDISSDGGQNFDTLEHNIDNDGLHVLVAPASSGSDYRVMISCPGNVFFDVSRANFSVNQSSGTDSDSDGIPDDIETQNNLNPNDPEDAVADADGDGLSNLEEYLLGTQLNNSDSDSDGMPDKYEIENGLNPLDDADALDDADGDGVSNRAEFNGQTDPNDPNSSVALTLKTFDFEQEGGLDGWSFGDSNAWSRVTDGGANSDASLGSNTTGDDQSSSVSYSGSMAAGEVTFFYKVSSEAQYDKFSFAVDGENVFDVSGEIDWTPFTYKVGAGEHTLTWTYAKDNVGASGSDRAWIDTVRVPLPSGNTVDDSNNSDGGTGNSTNKVAYDFDGDGKADVAVRRPSTSLQYIKNSADSEIQRIQFGLDENDIPISGDFDGDGKADVAVRRPGNQHFYIKNSSDGEIQRIQFGLQEADIPVPADYDGDGITDVAVRRASTQYWYIKNSSGVDHFTGNADGITRLNFGLQEADIPVPADYDGDGKADIAVRRPNNQFWYIKNSSDGEIQRIQFGLQEADIPVPADYDGDGKVDVAVRRASTQFWYIKNSSGVDPLTGNSDGITRLNFGLQADDIPVVADYDGDGKADVAVRRPGNQFFYIKNSSGVDHFTGNSDGITRLNFGMQEADVPIAGPVQTRISMVSGSPTTEPEVPELPALPDGVAGLSGEIEFSTANDGAPYELNQRASYSVSESGVFSLDVNPDANDGFEVELSTYSVDGAEVRWVDSNAGYTYSLSLTNGSLNEINVFNSTSNAFLGQFTPYSDSVDIENIELVTRYAGDYQVTASSGTHTRGTVSISSNGGVDFDTSISFQATDIVDIFDRTFIQGEPRVQINYGNDDDGPVIALYLTEDLSGIQSIMYRYRSENIETVVTVN